jgi:hypothetical protein
MPCEPIDGLVSFKWTEALFETIAKIMWPNRNCWHLRTWNRSDYLVISILSLVAGLIGFVS